MKYILIGLFFLCGLTAKSQVAIGGDGQIHSAATGGTVTNTNELKIGTDTTAFKNGIAVISGLVYVYYKGKWQLSSGGIDSTTRFGGLKTIYNAYLDSSLLRGLANTNAANIATNTSNIALKLNISDTAAMLTNYKSAINTNSTNIATNTTNISNEITRATAAELLKLNISDSLIKYVTPNNLKDSGTVYRGLIGGKIDSIRLANTGILHTTPAAFSLSGTTAVITQTLATQAASVVLRTGNVTGQPAFGKIDSTHAPDIHSQGYYDGRYGTVAQQNINAANIATNTSAITTKLNTSDTASMLSNYRTGIASLNADTATLINRFSAKLNTTDTASMLNNYRAAINTSNTAVATKLNISDTAAMLSAKQPTLVSGTNIKTVNGNTLLGSGNLVIAGGVTSVNTRTGAVVINSGDITTGLGYSPLDSLGSTYLKTVTLSNTGVIHNAPTYTYNAATKNYDIAQTLASQSPYKALTRASGTGVPSWNSLDSNYFGGVFQTQVRAAQADSIIYQSKFRSDTARVNIYTAQSNFVDKTTTQSVAGLKTITDLTTHLANGLASTQDYTKGILMQNTTASTAGVTQQISPAIVFQSQAWNTGGAAGGGVTSTNTSFLWKMEQRAIAGVNSTGMDNQLVLAQKYGSNAWADVATFNKSGLNTAISTDIISLGANTGVPGRLNIRRSDGTEMGRMTTGGSSLNIVSDAAQLITLGSSSNGIAYYTETGLWLGIGSVSNQSPLSRLVVGGGSNANVSIGSNIAAPTNGLAVVGQTLIGASSGNASAKLQVDATTQGFLPPRMTTAQKLAIASPATGLQVTDITTNTLNFYNGSAWVSSDDYLLKTGGTVSGNITANNYYIPAIGGIYSNASNIALGGAIQIFGPSNGDRVSIRSGGNEQLLINSSGITATSLIANTLKLNVAANSGRGAATLSSGTVTISNTSITTGAMVVITYASGSTLNIGVGNVSTMFYVPTITNGTSFVINALTVTGTLNTTDNSQVMYTIIN